KFHLITPGNAETKLPAPSVSTLILDVGEKLLNLSVPIFLPKSTSRTYRGPSALGRILVIGVLITSLLFKI
ncbi:hypothetical protein, partial [Pseudomonas paraeruginosa]|uniref:hypothetical protein n=1 Tax=Pseudomonas paraeruginosa TaxID=2994495 RepID=UPI003D2BD79F